MSKTLPTVICPKCSGEGKILIPHAAQDTLKLVTLNPGNSALWIHSKTLLGGSTVGVTAINNRLVYLENLGLICRKKADGCWKWTAVKGKK